MRKPPSRFSLQHVVDLRVICKGTELAHVQRLAGADNRNLEAFDVVCSLASPASTRVELRLSVLVFAKRETLPPQRLIPGTKNQPPCRIAVGKR
jgi:hypothetical protein